MMLTYLWKTFKVVGGIIFILLLTRTFIIETGRVNGVSMLPNYFDNQKFFVNKFALLVALPERGQVVHANDPVHNDLLIKRIIGLPGEQVRIFQNVVSITDTEGNVITLGEPYLIPNTITRVWNQTSSDYPVLGPDEYFVLGDNREASADSRHFGPLKRSDIIGLVIPQRN
ncbi:MAG: signal peptidase I [Patescibacteria group bacterium]